MEDGAEVSRALARSLLKKMGYRLVRAEGPGTAISGLESFFGAIKNLGFAPRSIFDIGANRGAWTRVALQFFPAAQYTLVEPQKELKVHVQDLLDRGCRIRWICAGASDAPGHLPFAIAGRDDSSTFAIAEPEARAASARQIMMEVTTLNTLAATQGGGTPEMVKIDAEGFDLRVLSGASELLGKTEIFLVEAAVCCGYPNSAAEVMKFMTSAGYRLMDITDLNRSPRHGVLWLCEFAFLRSDSRLLQAAQTYE